MPWTRDIQDTQHVLYMKKKDFQAAQEVRLARKRPPGTSRAQFWARECVCQEQVQRLIGKVTTKQDLPRTAVFNWSNYRKIHVWSQVLVHSTSMDGLKQMQINNNTKYIEPWNFWNVMWLKYDYNYWSIVKQLTRWAFSATFASAFLDFSSKLFN